VRRPGARSDGRRGARGGRRTLTRARRAARGGYVRVGFGQRGPPFQRARTRGRHSLITSVSSASLARLAPSRGLSSSPGRLLAPGPSPDPDKEISTIRLFR
jgi:hypothetical protein